VFDGLSLKVSPGERVAVLGPSEAGKSTLALCLQGLIPRMIKGEFRGLLEVAGCPTHVCRPRDLAGRVGSLFQDFEAQLFLTRVDQEVAFGPENLGLPREELQRRVKHSLSLVGLDHLAHRDPATLSGGQKQLLALAAVLALAPRLLVLDEPTTDLDPLRVEELLATLEALCQREKLTLMLLGEDLRLARHCSRLVLLQGGRVVADGPPETVLRQVDLFRNLGLQPPELPSLFHDLGQETLPLTLAEAEAQAKALGWERKPIKEADHGPPLTPPPPGGRGLGGGGKEFTPSLILPPQGGGEMETAPEVLALRRVSFAYPEGEAIFRDFSLNFKKDELTAILGPNGSGKTTLVKLLRGLLAPQAGEVWVGPEVERIGYVFQNPDYQLFAQEVWEEVAFGPKQMGLDPEEVERRVETALTRVHLKERAGDDPFSLTKGQRQRLAVASVLALAPQVIILDEPTTGLDFREQQDLLGLIAELHAQGHTIIMVTHSMWAAATYAQRLIVLDQGRVVLDGPTWRVLAQEEVLARCRLKPPEVTRLSQRLGFLALTAEEFRRRIAG